MREIRLLVREPGQAERRVTLFPGATVGRAQGNGLTLADPAASRSHLRLLKDGDGWFAEDIGSASGTVVDGKETLRKDQRVRLKHNMQLTAGDTVMVVQLEAETEDRTVPGGPKKGDEARLEVENTIPAVPPFGGSRKPAAPAKPTAPSKPAAPLPPTPAPAPPPPRDRTEPRVPTPAPPRDRTAPRPAPAPAAPPKPEPAPEPEPEPIEDVVAPESKPPSGSMQTRPLDTKEQLGLALRPKLLARNARLVLVGNDVRRSVSITCTPFLVGRSEQAQLMLTDSSISTAHARVLFEGDGDRFVLLDLDSRNGTFAGSERLAPEVAHGLTAPAWLRFGTVEAWFVDDPSSTSAQNRIDRAACDVLVRSGRLTAADKRQAVDAARSDRRHLSEVVLQQTRLSVAEWADAVQRRRKVALGSKGVLLLLLLAALAGLAYWLFARQ